MKLGTLVGLLIGVLAALVAPASAQEPPPPEARLQPFQPFRVAQFSRYLADGTEVFDEPIIRDGGRLNFHQRFPDSHFDREPNDGLNIGRIFSSPSGVTYGVEVQSPGNNLFNAADPTREIGNKAELTQFQNFRKDAADATLHYTVTAVEIEAVDESLSPPHRPQECPAEDTTCQFTMEGEAALTVSAYLTDVPPVEQQFFYHASGAAKLTGFVDSFLPEIYIDPLATDVPWEEADFEFDGDADPGDIPGSFSFLQNEFTVTSEVDISSVPVGEEFTLEINTFARTYDRRLANGDDRLGSTVFAYLRDPLDVGGSQLQTTGLTRVPGPLTDPPQPAPLAPVECANGADPAAGTLQFSAAASAVGEWAGASPQVFVTRTGGSTGEVSVTVATSDGTAVAGTDYTPLSTTIRFGDGDTTRRAVPVEIAKDAIAEDDKTVNLALSEPSCTTLGAPANTVLTIVDDEPDPEFTIGGTVTGLEGSGLALKKNGLEEITPGNGPFEFSNTALEGETYEVTVDAQPSNPAQICTVTNGSGIVAEADVTDIAVDCATPPPDAGLDPSFGDGGKVTTPGLETALAVAVQPDGRIVASSDNALARYDPDGTLDDTFGDRGVVATAIDADNCFPSAANDLALQPDGSIVVVGLVTDASTNEDVALQRYDTAGNLDLGFGDQGTVTTDFAGGRDCVYGVTLQPDGKIVVAGGANGDVTVLRYDATGTPDPSFGTGGTGSVVTPIGSELDVATDVTLDANGNIVVVARVSDDSDLGFFSVLRYTPDGVLDPALAGDGITGFDPGTAEAVAIDGDGRIVVAGSFQSEFAVWRFLPSGDRDSTFSGDGITTADFSDGFSSDFGHDLALQPDAKIVVAGTAEGVNRGDLAMARWGPDGSLDTSFGDSGTLTVDFHAGFDSGGAVALQPDGKIVAGGSAVNVTTVEQTLTRVQS